MFNMPSTNRLHFMRQLYDIALWQYFLLAGLSVPKGKNLKVVFTRRKHKIVASLMCKLLEAEAFVHLQKKLTDRDVQIAMGFWKPGETVTEEIVTWCQDQWRRKLPIYSENEYLLNNAPTSAVTIFGKSMPVCHKCGIPCPECRTRLGKEMPEEMDTAKSFLNYDSIHSHVDGK